MDQGSYLFEVLEKRYDHFRTPKCEVSINGNPLSKNKIAISSLEVELSADGTAGGCSFTIDGQYNYEHSKWENNALELVKPGAKISIRGGYAQGDKELFFGYVDDYTIEFQQDGPPRLSVSALDGLGYLMSFREPLYGGKRKAAEIVKSILQKSVSAGFAKKITMGTLPDFETPILKEQVDDWKFLNLMAQRCGVTLFTVAGEMIFDNVISRSSPILTLSIGRGLISFQKRVSLAHQVGQVEVWGRDVKQKAIKGTASRLSIGGSGKSATELVPDLSKAVLREYSEYARTQEECSRLAQNRLNSIAMGLVSGSGLCIGLPELIPGRYLKITGGDASSNGRYFITKVRHLFDENGYQTAFEIRGAKT